MSEKHYNKCPDCGVYPYINKREYCDDDWGRFWETEYTITCPKCARAVIKMKKNNAIFAWNELGGPE